MAVGEREREMLRRHLPTSWPRISPRWSSPRTWPARWRRSPARSRSTGASPASSSTACRSASTSSTGTTGSRSGTASGRPAPRACGGTRWSAGRCSTCSPGSRRRSSAPSSTGSSRPARSSRRSRRSPSAARSRYFRLSKIPMRLDGDAITHVITIGEDVTEWRADAGADHAEREAGGDRPARRRRHARDQQPARHHRRLRRGDRGPAATAGTGDAAATGEYLRDHRQARSSAAPGSSTGCSTSAGRRRQRKAPLSLNALVEETLFLLKHHQRFKRLTVARELAPGLPPRSWATRSSSSRCSWR